jgi:hypothetical protein
MPSHYKQKGIIGGQTNWRDPRYQKALLRGMATQYSPGGENALMSRIAGAHAGREFGTRIQLANTETTRLRDVFNNQMAHKRLNLDSHMFDQRRKDSRQSMNRGIWLGLSTSLLGGIEGRRRAQKIEASQTKRDAVWEEMLGMMKAERAKAMPTQEVIKYAKKKKGAK